MLVVFVDGQFSANGTNAEEQVALIVGQYRDRLCLLINSTDV